MVAKSSLFFDSCDYLLLLTTIKKALEAPLLCGVVIHSSSSGSESSTSIAPITNNVANTSVTNPISANGSV